MSFIDWLHFFKVNDGYLHWMSEHKLTLSNDSFTINDVNKYDSLYTLIC